MRSLTIDIFTSSIEDQELSEYKVLAALKNYSEMLHKNILYPALTEIMEIFQVLVSILKQRENFRAMKSRRITSIDLENKKFIYEDNKEEIDIHNIRKVFEFIDWAMPKIKEVLNEGTAIFDFVESQIKIKEIGILPFYKDEGYFIVPDHKQKEIHVFRFQLSNIINSDIPFKTLKTSLVESHEEKKITSAPESIKLELIKKYPDLPNPATYKVSTELDMPFNETILPVAKRKMMRQLAA